MFHQVISEAGISPRELETRERQQRDRERRALEMREYSQARKASGFRRVNRVEEPVYEVVEERKLDWPGYYVIKSGIRVSLPYLKIQHPGGQGPQGQHSGEAQ